jgi:hypothetical protein
MFLLKSTLTSWRSFVFYLVAPLLCAGATIHAVATSTLDVQQDDTHGWAETAYNAGESEFLAVHFDGTTECHVWGRGYCNTGNTQDWGRIAGDEEVYDGEIVNADPPQWRVKIGFKYHVYAVMDSGSENTGMKVTNWTKLTGDVVALAGACIASGNRLTPDADDPDETITIFSIGETDYTITQVVAEEATGGYYNILNPSYPFNLVGVLNEANLDFTMLQITDMQMDISDSGHVEIKCQENDENRNSITGYVESWDMGNGPTGTIIESYTVD